MMEATHSVGNLAAAGAAGSPDMLLIPTNMYPWNSKWVRQKLLSNKEMQNLRERRQSSSSIVLEWESERVESTRCGRIQAIQKQVSRMVSSEIFNLISGLCIICATLMIGVRAHWEMHGQAPIVLSYV